MEVWLLLFSNGLGGELLLFPNGLDGWLLLFPKGLDGELLFPKEFGWLFWLLRELILSKVGKSLLPPSNGLALPLLNPEPYLFYPLLLLFLHLMLLLLSQGLLLL